ncbi:hypothetical protein LZ198_03990 [Myxococcus sp. K15C18031901]|uniref:hypothetical protein n=1 Tax=Myxococcus dinghuensis TaxID=2906761 RepID=UPI0020A79513|nr:hypothetical protein [Myxococcus dinghuensis]MCP3098035.1 hypothetical protein [Myxococcus dinghuensis]
MPDSVDAALLALFQRSDLPYDTVEDAWRRSAFLAPLVGWVAARFPEERAFRVCADWLARLAERIPEAKPAADLFAQAADTSQGPHQANVVAGRLGDLRNASILARRPAAAAFADGASDLAEVWAAATKGPADDESDPWARARAASHALVTAWVLHAGQDPEDKALRAAATKELLALLRECRAGGLEET